MGDFAKCSKTRDGKQRWCRACFQAKNQEWRDKHGARIADYNRRYKDENREAIQAQRVIYRRNNREKRAAYKREYRRKYPEQHREEVRRRNSRIRSVESEEYTTRQVFERDSGICYLCGELLFLDVPHPERSFASIDHVVPISRGGADTLDNVRIACLSCNLRKNDKTVEEYLG